MNTNVQFLGERNSKDGIDYLCIQVAIARGTTSPFTVTQEGLIVNLDRDLQKRVYDALKKVFAK